MSRRQKLVLLILVITGSAILGRFLLRDDFEVKHLVAALRGSTGSGWRLGAFTLAFGVGTTLFVPSIVLMVTAGAIWGFWPGWLVVWVAANVWANVHFSVGRWGGGDVFREALERRGWAWLVREFDRGGVWGTTMVRQFPIPFMLVNLAAGASPVRWKHFVVGNALGLLPNCIIYTQIAAALIDGVEGARARALFRVAVAATSIIGLGVLVRWWDSRRNRAAGVPALQGQKHQTPTPRD
jgi:uncharacterized membrane protein YdjX (TVP38/TMEM64 family)